MPCLTYGVVARQSHLVPDLKDPRPIVIAERRDRGKTGQVHRMFNATVGAIKQPAAVANGSEIVRPRMICGGVAEGVSQGSVPGQHMSLHHV